MRLFIRHYYISGVRICDEFRIRDYMSFLQTSGCSIPRLNSARRIAYGVSAPFYFFTLSRFIIIWSVTKFHLSYSPRLHPPHLFRLRRVLISGHQVAYIESYRGAHFPVGEFWGVLPSSISHGSSRIKYYFGPL